MILKHNANNQQTYGMNNSHSFSINASAHVFKVLSDGLYSDKFKAIVRELSCNAFDSQKQANTNKPFFVHLPTKLENFFIIRDYGTGLCDEDMHTLYTTYFESTKQQSNDYIGALGLGSKSPFCYSDAFVVESYFEGIKSTYSMFIDESGFPNINKVHSELTEEENGLKISIEIQEKDINQFNTTAKLILNEFDPLPECNLELQKVNYLLKHKTFETRRGSYLFVKQGSIVYPVDKNIIKNYYINCNDALVIYADIGDIEFTASRESIQYTKATIDKLNEKFDLFLKELKELAKTKLDKAFEENCTLDVLTQIKNDELFKSFISSSKMFEYKYKNNSLDMLNLRYEGIKLYFLNTQTEEIYKKQYGRSKQTMSKYSTNNLYSTYTILVKDMKMSKQEIRHHFINSTSSYLYIINADTAKRMLETNSVTKEHLTYMSDIALSAEDKLKHFIKTSSVKTDNINAQNIDGSMCQLSTEEANNCLYIIHSEKRKYNTDCYNLFEVLEKRYNKKIYIISKLQLKKLKCVSLTDKINEDYSYLNDILIKSRENTSTVKYLIDFTDESQQVEEQTTKKIENLFNDSIEARLTLSNICSKIISSENLYRIKTKTDKIYADYPVLRYLGEYTIKAHLEDVKIYMQAKKGVIMQKLQYIKSDTKLIVFIDGKSYSINSTDPKYSTISTMLMSNAEYSTIKEVLDKKVELRKKISSFGFEINDLSEIYYNDTKIPVSTALIIKQFVDLYGTSDHEDCLSLQKFVINLMQNPDYINVEDLYDFLQKGDLPITDDGHFLAYKVVNYDFYDKHTRKYDNSVGKTVYMDRKACDTDRNNTCSAGLHFCSRSYISSFISNGDKIIEVKINPKDVTSIPVDYNQAKGRCCSYKVIRVIDSPDLEKEKIVKQEKSIYEKAVEKAKDCYPYRKAEELKCSKCGQYKSFSSFYVDRSNKRGFRSECKACKTHK